MPLPPDPPPPILPTSLCPSLLHHAFSGLVSMAESGGRVVVLLSLAEAYTKWPLMECSTLHRQTLYNSRTHFHSRNGWSYYTVLLWADGFVVACSFLTGQEWNWFTLAHTPFCFCRSPFPLQAYLIDFCPTSSPHWSWLERFHSGACITRKSYVKTKLVVPTAWITWYQYQPLQGSVTLAKRCSNQADPQDSLYGFASIYCLAENISSNFFMVVIATLTWSKTSYLFKTCF